MPIQEYGQPTPGSYTAPKKRRTTTYDPIATSHGGIPLSTALQIAPAREVFEKYYTPTIPSAPTAPSAPSGGGGYIAPTGGGMPTGLLDLYKMILGGMGGGMPAIQMPTISSIQLPQYPDIQGMLEEQRTAAYEQALKQKGISTRTIEEQVKEALRQIGVGESEIGRQTEETLRQFGVAESRIGEQAAETLKTISEMKDKEKRLAAIDAASRGVFESGLLTKALAKVVEKYATGETKTLTEKQYALGELAASKGEVLERKQLTLGELEASRGQVATQKQTAMDALEAALLGVKSTGILQTMPMMQQAWQGQYGATMDAASLQFQQQQAMAQQAMQQQQSQWQQRQSGMQNALQLYEMQLQDRWRRQSAGQTYTSPSQYMGGQEGIVNQFMNMFSGQGFPEQLGFGRFTGLGV